MPTAFLSWDKELDIAKEAGVNEDTDDYNIISGENDFVFTVDESYIDDDGELYVSGGIVRKGKDIVYMNMKFPLTLNLGAAVVADYMKKLGRLKTILEASK